MRSRLSFTFSLVLILTVILGNSASAVPAVPLGPDAPPPVYSLYGTAGVGGVNPPNGTVVTAWCGTLQVGTTVTQVQADGLAWYWNLDVPGDDPDILAKDGCYANETVTFKIAGVAADQSVPWRSLSPRVDLTVTPTGGARLYLSPTMADKSVAQIFTFDIQVDTGIASADTVDAYLDFNPTFLEVVTAGGQLATSIELNTAVFGGATVNSVDNATGRINFSASKATAPFLSGAFTAATVRFRAKAAVGSTPVSFSRGNPRKSDLFRSGTSLLPSTAGGSVGISSALTLPSRVAIERRGSAGDPRWVTPLFRVNTDQSRVLGGQGVSRLAPARFWLPSGPPQMLTGASRLI